MELELLGWSYMHGKQILFILLFLLFSNNTYAKSTTVNITNATALGINDTIVVEGMNTYNFGAATAANIKWASGGVIREYIKINLSSLTNLSSPDNVTSALYCSYLSSYSAGVRNITVLFVNNTNWLQGTLDAGGDCNPNDCSGGITWSGATHGTVQPCNYTEGVPNATCVNLDNNFSTTPNFAAYWACWNVTNSAKNYNTSSKSFSLMLTQEINNSGTSNGDKIFNTVFSASNSSYFTFTYNPPDSAPTLSASWKNVSSPVYSSGAAYRFNITACDADDATDLDKILFEWNGTTNTSITDYITQNTSCRNYTTTKTDLPAGTYTLKWFANDSYNVWANISDSYTINKGTPTITALINGSTSDVGYPQYTIFNLTGMINTNYNVNITLSLNATGYGNNYKWAVDKNVTNVTNLTAVGYFLFNVSFYGDANWSAVSDWSYLTMSAASSPAYSNLKTSQTAPLQFNPDLTHQFNATWTDTAGISKVFFEFNGTNYTAQNASSEYYYNFSSLKAYNYSYRWYANNTFNAWTSTASYQYNFTRNNTNYLNLNMSTGTDNINTNISVLSTDSVTLFYWSDLTSQSVLMYVDNGLVSNSYSNTFGVGTHNVTVSTAGDENYTSNYITYWIASSAPSTPPSGDNSGFPPIPNNTFTLTPESTTLIAPLKLSFAQRIPYKICSTSKTNLSITVTFDYQYVKVVNETMPMSIAPGQCKSFNVDIIMENMTANGDTSIGMIAKDVSGDFKTATIIITSNLLIGSLKDYALALWSRLQWSLDVPGNHPFTIPYLGLIAIILEFAITYFIYNQIGFTGRLGRWKSLPFFIGLAIAFVILWLIPA